MNALSSRFARHVAVVLFLSLPARAALAPDLLNYQGVLRSAGGDPLNGSFDMTFRFIDGATSGEILVDAHTGPLRVVVTGGLFNTQLGGGIVSDGSSAGTYTALSQVFRDFGNVLLRITVNGETLSPDTRVVSAGYAMNSSYLNGVFESQFLRSDENDTAVGKIFFAGTPSGPGISQGSVFISPTSAFSDQTLLGVAVNASERFRIDADGDTTVEGSLKVNAPSGFALQVADDLYVNSGLPFVGVGRSTRLTGAEAFGIRATTAANSYGGMYIDTSNATGWPFYGYATGGTQQAWTYLESGVNKWHLYNNGGVRLTVDGEGDVGIGTTNPGTYGLWVSQGPVRFGSASNEEAYLASTGFGIEAYGDNTGGYFHDNTSGSFAWVGMGTSKIQGSGSVSFVQNHPEDPSRVIVYASPEGDEVATYTRGSARLVDGEARVGLGATFQWVTNPDLGLTAQVTPIGSGSDLYVAEKSTRELVVRSRGGDPDAAFDYIVWGLRIGFEEQSVVQEKQVEARIPSMADHRERYAREPELRAFNALERFKTMDAAVNPSGSRELARSVALRDAIGEYDPGKHGTNQGLAGTHAETEVDTEAQISTFADDAWVLDSTTPPRSSQILGTCARKPRICDKDGDTDARIQLTRRQDRSLTAGASAEPPGRERATTQMPEPAVQLQPTDPESTLAPNVVWMPVSEPVDPGEVLAFDPERPGFLRRASSPADVGVLGASAGGSRSSLDGRKELEVPVAAWGVIQVLADAGYGEIRPGDLLVASATPGHCMRAVAEAPGTILGKAIDGLEAGTRRIRVLVMSR